MPLFEIKSRLTGTVLFSLECGSLKLCVEAAIAKGINLSAADLRSADLRGADLSAADLRSADLRDANLSGANLSGANLRSADLSGANLSGANLSGTNLRAADLSGANLSGTNLRAADLSGANLSEANMDTGETYAEYVEQIMPALLTAGGKPLESFRDHWQCHSWDNCPMAHAFDVHNAESVPPIHRTLARQFVKRFDSGQLPVAALDRAIAASASVKA